jgi:hypothetical protein
LKDTWAILSNIPNPYDFGMDVVQRLGDGWHEKLVASMIA